VKGLSLQCVERLLPARGGRYPNGFEPPWPLSALDTLRTILRSGGTVSANVRGRV
jgi:hypothetical protein